MRTSDQLDQIAPALVAALGTLDDITKSNRADMGSYSYSYADLASILRTARPVLTANGLVAQSENYRTDTGLPACRTRLTHLSGQWIETEGTIVPESRNAGPQETGSAYTYARRYDLLPFLGLATEDDDGQRAQTAKQQETYVDEQLAGRVRVVMGQMQRMTDTDKAALKQWADGRRLSGHALVTDEHWLVDVENWLDEHRDTEASPA